MSTIGKWLMRECFKCANPNCKAEQPYFVRENKKHKYCSTACVADAKRVARLTWWRNHGNAWAAARLAKVAQ